MEQTFEQPAVPSTMINVQSILIYHQVHTDIQWFNSHFTG